jgi:hypothetical protein
MLSEENVAVIKGKFKELENLLSAVDVQTKGIRGSADLIKGALAEKVRTLKWVMADLEVVVGALHDAALKARDMKFVETEVGAEEDEFWNISEGELAAHMNRWALGCRRIASCIGDCLFEEFGELKEERDIPRGRHGDPDLIQSYEADRPRMFVRDMKKVMGSLNDVAGVLSEISAATGAAPNENDNAPKSAQPLSSSGHFFINGQNR